MPGKGNFYVVQIEALAGLSGPVHQFTRLERDPQFVPARPGKSWPQTARIVSAS